MRQDELLGHALGYDNGELDDANIDNVNIDDILIGDFEFNISLNPPIDVSLNPPTDDELQYDLDYDTLRRWELDSAIGDLQDEIAKLVKWTNEIRDMSRSINEQRNSLNEGALSRRRQAQRNSKRASANAMREISRAYNAKIVQAQKTTARRRAPPPTPLAPTRPVKRIEPIAQPQIIKVVTVPAPVHHGSSSSHIHGITQAPSTKPVQRTTDVSAPAAQAALTPADQMRAAITATTARSQNSLEPMTSTNREHRKKPLPLHANEKPQPPVKIWTETKQGHRKP